MVGKTVVWSILSTHNRSLVTRASMNTKNAKKARFNSTILATEDTVPTLCTKLKWYRSCGAKGVRGWL